MTSTTRSDVLPDLPTVSEFVPGYEASAWYGIGAPKDTPAEIIDKLNKAVNAILDDTASKARFAELEHRCFRVRPQILENSSPKKPKSGARWSNSAAQRRTNP